MKYKKILKPKILLWLVLLPLFCIAAARFTHRQTQGFRLSKIRENTYPLNDLNISAAASDEESLAASILQNKFYYFARGLQSFVFISADQKYVLKLFNNQHQRAITWLSYLPSFDSIDPWKKKQLEIHSQKLKKTFESYAIAYTDLKAETGLIYLHLFKTACFHHPLTLVDNLGIEHQMDPDQMGFLIQKKALLAYPSLDVWIAQGQIEEAKAGLRNLIQGFITLSQKGIRDSDPLIRTNVGFLDSQPLFIDVGPFSWDPLIKEPAIYRKEIYRITTSLKLWLQPKSPELCAFLEEELDTTLHNHEN